MGATFHRTLSQIPVAQRAYNRDCSRVVAWYVSRHDEDRHDETIEYRIGVFDAVTECELIFFATSIHSKHSQDNDTNEELVSAVFDPEDELIVVLKFASGITQRRQLNQIAEALRLTPEDFGGVMSDAERRIRKRFESKKL